MRAIDVDGAKRLAEECWPNPVHRLAIDGLLDMCPIIDPKSFQTHGQWNDIKSEVLNTDTTWICRCSLCGCPQDYKHNYCPNCGAKMDGQVERDG